MEGRYIIEDDFDSEFRLVGKPMATLQSIDVAERVIYMNTFTKSLASTIRISYMVLPPHLLNEFYERLGFYACTVSSFEQYTLARFIEEGYFEKHINRMRNYYRTVRDCLLEEIKKKIQKEKVQILEEDAGLHFPMRVETGQTDDALVMAAARQGIRLSCMGDYYFDGSPKEAEHTIIMNYSAIRREDIADAVDNLCRCL